MKFNLLNKIKRLPFEEPFLKFWIGLVQAAASAADCVQTVQSIASIFCVFFLSVFEFGCCAHATVGASASVVFFARRQAEREDRRYSKDGKFFHCWMRVNCFCELAANIENKIESVTNYSRKIFYFLNATIDENVNRSGLKKVKRLFWTWKRRI